MSALALPVLWSGACVAIVAHTLCRRLPRALEELALLDQSDEEARLCQAKPTKGNVALLSKCQDTDEPQLNVCGNKAVVCDEHASTGEWRAVDLRCVQDKRRGRA